VWDKRFYQSADVVAIAHLEHLKKQVYLGFIIINHSGPLLVLDSLCLGILLPFCQRLDFRNLKITNDSHSHILVSAKTSNIKIFR